MGKPKKFWNGKWVDYATALCAAILFYLIIAHFNVIWAGLGKMIGFIRPVIIGVVIAYVMNPLVKIFKKYVFGRFLKRERTVHYLSVIAAIVAVGVFIVLLLVALIPQLIESIVTFFSNLGSYINSLSQLISQLSSNMSSAGADTTQFDDISSMLLSALSSIVPTNPSAMVGTFTNISVSIFDFVIGIIMAIYFLMDSDHLVSEVQRFLKLVIRGNGYAKVAGFAGRCNAILVRFIAGDLLDGFLVGLANFIFMSIAGINYAILISVVVGVTNLAPTFGPVLGGAIGAIILVLVNPWHALWFLIFTVIIQIIDGYILKPKLFGSTLGVSGIWILICIVTGGKIFGMWGIILAIPFAAISDFIYHDNFLVFLQKEKDKRMTKAKEKEKSKDKDKKADAMESELVSAENESL